MQNPLHEAEHNEEILPVSEWLVELNQQLAAAAASAAEQAFGRGCSVSLVPMAIILGLAFLFGVRHWVSLSLVGIFLVLLATAWAVYVALQAHRNGPRRAWQEHLRAETEVGLQARSTSRAQLDLEARKILPEEALLLKALRGEFESLNHTAGGTHERR